WLDVASMATALLGVSMPSFWLGLLLIFVFSLHLGWFPATGGGSPLHLVLPGVTPGTIPAALIARLPPSRMLEVLGQDYVRTARAKGLGGFSVVVRHALKNALIPIITIFGLQFGNLLAGAVIVETVFSRPGLGRLIVGGILAKDFPLVQGTVLFVATVYVMINVLVDVAYAYADPRARFGGRRGGCECAATADAPSGRRDRVGDPRRAGDRGAGRAVAEPARSDQDRAAHGVAGAGCDTLARQRSARARRGQPRDVRRP